MKRNQLPHDSAEFLVSGEAEFIDDRPPVKGELFLVPVYSEVAHAKIKKIEIKDAANLEGVVGIFGGADLAHNKWGPIQEDQPLFATDEVSFVGEPILVIAANSQSTAVAARKLVKLDYDELPSILGIDEALKASTFLCEPKIIARGTVDSALPESDHVVESTFNSNGQDHFYLESHASIAYPEEGGRIVVHSSSQHPTEVQHIVAHALGISFNQVVCVVKRMGGGFGGKESQAAVFATMAALVAQKTGRAARMVLSKDDDMIMTGNRHPFKSFYKVGFSKEGMITGLDIKMYSDGGAFADLSTSILDRALLHIDNAYFIPHLRVEGRVCQTNIHPNTAFRGFGGPQAIAVIESIIEDIAVELGCDALIVRQKNLYGVSGNETHYGQLVKHPTLEKIVAELSESSQYDQRRKDVVAFNDSNEFCKRGLALTLVKFGISFTSRFLNQGNAQVNVHTDGSVQVSTGATEMGQGVNTKIQSVVADTFGICPSKVRVMSTSTEKNHNTSPTAASSGSDLNAKAAQLAAEKIRTRLAQVALWKEDRPADKEIELKDERNTSSVLFEEGQIKNEQGQVLVSFSDCVKKAYMNRISLGEYQHYKTPGIYFDKEKGKGNPFFYYTCGGAVSEVLVDTLTGEVKVLATDILMDLGRPLQHGIDYGQVCGGFVQGMGWSICENLFYHKGKQLTHSPTTYKIPNIADTPRRFKVDFLEADNPVGVKGSKAVGEPPLLLGVSTFAAVKNALASLVGATPELKLPANNESILRCIYAQTGHSN